MNIKSYKPNMYFMKSTPSASKLKTHTLHEIYYFHKGVGTYIIGDDIYTLAPGDLIIMHGMTLHCANINPNFPYVRSIVNFLPDFARKVSAELFSYNVLQPFDQLKNYRIRLQDETKIKFEKQMASMHELYVQKGPIAHHRFILAFFDLLHTINEYCSTVPSMRSDLGDARSKKELCVKDTIAFLKNHYKEDLTMDRLAESLHYNRHYLSRAFREITGTTIFNYMYELRIREAKVYLQRGTMKSVAEVCYHVGFNNVSHFCRVFKQLVGCTPSKYYEATKNPNLESNSI